MSGKRLRDLKTSGRLPLARRPAQQYSLHTLRWTGELRDSRPGAFCSLAETAVQGRRRSHANLAEQFGIAWAQVDDFRLTMQRVTTPEEQPALHFFTATEHVWRGPASAVNYTKAIVRN